MQQSVNPVIKLLFISANAPRTNGGSPIRPEVEYRELKDRALPRGKESKHFRLLPAEFAARVDDFQAALLRHRPHIVHFGGHGHSSGIELEDELGRSKIVDTRALGQLFEALKTPAYKAEPQRVALIVLNACFSLKHARNLVAAADFTIGIDREILDEDSINFATSFYNALTNGCSIAAALHAALGNMRMKRFDASQAIDLFCAKGADPNKPFIDHVAEAARVAHVKRDRPSAGRAGVPAKTGSEPTPSGHVSKGSRKRRESFADKPMKRILQEMKKRQDQRRGGKR